jgi:hypothetical protein
MCRQIQMADLDVEMGSAADIGNRRLRMDQELATATRGRVQLVILKIPPAKPRRCYSHHYHFFVLLNLTAGENKIGCKVDCLHSFAARYMNIQFEKSF